MRDQHLRDYPVWDKGNQHSLVRCDVSYAKGGMNMWSYKNEPRGYWLHVQPLIEEQCDGFKVQHITPGAGKKFFLLEAKRYSDKAMRDAVTLAEQKLSDPNVLAFIDQLTRVPVEV